VNDGTPIISYKFPNWGDISGRNIGEEEKKLVLEVLESGHLGMVNGSMVTEFQRLWAEKFGVDTAVATSSGTAALHTALIYACVGAGDEVLVPCISDMGTVIAILLQNAIPVFVDVDLLAQNMNPEDFERKITSRSKVVIPVHMFGLPCDMDRILQVAKKHKIIVIEDCCQAHFSKYKGKIVGTIGDIGCVSFQQTKHVTTGEGGMVITNSDQRYSRKLQLCADKGWPRDKYRDHYFLAPNYHMTELQAAVGIAQLGKLDEMVIHRQRSARALSRILSGIDGVTPPPEPQGYEHTYFAYQFIVDFAKFGADREAIVKAICAEGLPIVPSYLPQPLYKYDFLQDITMYNSTRCPVECTYYGKEVDYRKIRCEVAEKACSVGLFLPWNEKITIKNAEDAGNVIKKVLESYRN
jgi:perosamine synthetase